MKFSIITVCLNAVDTIEQTIKSVIKQNYNDIEYIVIDGGSTDGTLDIIKKYDQEIAYLISESDSGIYDAMNKGIEKSTGDVISFINADDWYEDGIIKKINQYFLENEIDIVGGAVNYIVSDNLSTIIYSKYDLKRIYLYSACQHQAIFAKKEVFKKIGVFNLKYKLLADYEWMLRAWKNRMKFFEIKDICANFRNCGVTSYYTYNATLESMQAAQEILGDKYKDEIERFYDSKLEMTFYEQILECEVKDGDIDFVKSFLTADEYYIWGAGRVGMRCFEILEKLGIGVRGFIDSYKYKELQRIGKYEIYSPENIDKEVKICVAVREFENQVEQKLIEMGYYSDDYLLFSDLTKKIVEYKTGKKYMRKI